MKIKLNFRLLSVILFILFISTFFVACNNQNSSSQNHNKGIVQFDNQQYSAVRNFQMNQSYFNNKGNLKSVYSKHIGNINGGAVYSINGLNIKDWIYYNFADCDVSFYLSKNINKKLNDKYFDFLDKFQLIKYNYTIKNGIQQVINTTIKNKAIVSYAYKIASLNGNSDMGVTSDKVTAYSLLLTPKAFPALQYTISYYECENGYFIGSNINGLNTKVDNSIHEMINRLK